MTRLRALWRYRNLLRLWTLREIRVRYKQSFVGAAWAIVQPLALALMFTAVFSRLIKVPTGDIPYPLFSYTAVLLWTFFTGGINSGINSLIHNSNLVGKVYFPREILPLAAVGAALVDLLVASSGVAVLLAYYRWPLSATALWLLPLLGCLVLLMTGLALLGAAAIVYYRDVRFLVPLGLQLLFYASPILYPVELVPEELRRLYALNPLVGILSGSRDALLLGTAPDARSFWPAVLASLLCIGGGYLVFKRAERGFADVI
jgi:ABC-2 type transport system permease protein/lipopolysaccharide transport system permease protein